MKDKTDTSRFRGTNKKITIPKPIKNTSSSRPSLVAISTQTEDIHSTEKGREPVQAKLQPPKFPLSCLPQIMPDYRNNLVKIIGEFFVVKATKQDRSIAPLMKKFKDKDWESLKETNK